MYEINLNMPVKVKLTEEGKLRADDYGLCVIWKDDYVEMSLLNFMKIFGGEESFIEFGAPKFLVDNSASGNVVVDEKSFDCYVNHCSKEMQELNQLMHQDGYENYVTKNIIKYLRLHIKYQKSHISKEIKELEQVKERILKLKQKQKTKIR